MVYTHTLNVLNNRRQIGVTLHSVSPIIMYENTVKNRPSNLSLTPDRSPAF